MVQACSCQQWGVWPTGTGSKFTPTRLSAHACTALRGNDANEQKRSFKNIEEQVWNEELMSDDTAEVSEIKQHDIVLFATILTSFWTSEAKPLHSVSVLTYQLLDCDIIHTCFHDECISVVNIYYLWLNALLAHELISPQEENVRLLTMCA